MFFWQIPAKIMLLIICNSRIVHLLCPFVHFLCSFLNISPVWSLSFRPLFFVHCSLSLLICSPFSLIWSLSFRPFIHFLCPFVTKNTNQTKSLRDFGGRMPPLGYCLLFAIHGQSHVPSSIAWWMSIRNGKGKWAQHSTCDHFCLVKWVLTSSKPV